MYAWFIEPYTFDFMLQALAIATLTAIPAAALSCVLVLKNWSLMGDAVSHSVLPGIVIAYVIGLPMLLGAFITGLLCALLTGYFSTRSRVKEDTVMGVVFSGLFALGLVLFTKIQTDLHLDHVLFGDMLGVTWTDIVITGMLAGAVVSLFLIKQRDLMLFAFDEQHAGIVGLNVPLLHFGLLSILAMVIVASIKAVGIILVIAVLIAPGSIAYLLTSRFNTMVWIAILLSIVCSYLGVTLSFHIDSAPAPTIVLLMSIVFIFVFLFAPRHGILRVKFP
ncbi:MAG: metal ABC transporter permease [Gammaproteobacteria bacterium]|nr:metal ABC transporter permease [Gammaproteobacteria bacterium]